VMDVAADAASRLGLVKPRSRPADSEKVLALF